MELRVYILKIRQRLRSYLRRLTKPLRVETLEEFFADRFRDHVPLNTYFSSRKSPRFFFDPRRASEYRKAMLERFPKSSQQIIKRANKALTRRFSVLGSGEYEFTDSINWHLDFKSGKTWPLKPFPQIEIVDFDDDSDVKVPWELSRLQHFTDLGRAYWLTGDDAYTQAFVEHLESWMRDNPVDYGVNWTCSMEIAIRAINIIWGMYLFSVSPQLDSEFIWRVIRLLYYHGLHIERNLEITGRGSNSNHLLCNYLGLYYLGTLFREYDRAEQWRETAIKGLETEIRDQVFEDGADYECSTSYHRLVEEIFLSAFILGQRNQQEFSGRYRTRLSAMVEYSKSMTGGSGKTPLIGDNDDGFIVKLSVDDPASHSHLIENGLVALGQSALHRFPPSEERLWYHGPESLDEQPTVEAPSRAVFKESGYAIIGSERMHLVFAAGSIRKGHLGGHKHNDNLSFTLELDSVPVFIDPGTFCYTSDYRLRNRNQSTGCHNTVVIDSLEQNHTFEKRLFYMADNAHPVIDLWLEHEDIVAVSGYHVGYVSQSGITHRRTIFAFLSDQAVVIKDDLTGGDGRPHYVSVRLITAIRNVETPDNNQLVIRTTEKKSISVHAFGSTAATLRTEDSEYYPRYGVVMPARMIRFDMESTTPLTHTMVIAESHARVNWQQRTNEFINRFSHEFAQVHVAAATHGVETIRIHQ